MEYEIHNIDELYHWGIKGQRWGIRRYQNKDGSLTPAGKRRLKKETDAIRKEEVTVKNRMATKAKFDKLSARRAALEEKKKALDADENKKKADEAEASKKKVVDNQQPKKKTLADMSDEELARAITRSRMEDEYRRLHPEPKAPEKNAFAKQMLNDVIKPAAINSGKKLAQEAMDGLVKKITGDKVDPDSIDVLKKTFEKLDYKQKIDKLKNPDKYLSEEDKNKRQDREFKAEDRAAQKEGYANAAAKAKAEADRAKAEASNKARDEFVSKARPDADASSRRQSSWEKTTSNVRDEFDFDFDFSSSASTPVTSLSKSRVSRGKSTVDDYMDYSYSELLDSSGNVLLSWGDDD